MTPLPPILLHVSISRQEKILSSKEGKEEGRKVPLDPTAQHLLVLGLVEAVVP